MRTLGTDLLPGVEVAPGPFPERAGGTSLPVLCAPALVEDSAELVPFDSEAERLSRWRLGLTAELLAIRRREIGVAALRGEDLVLLANRLRLPLRLVRDEALRALTSRAEPPHDTVAALARLRGFLALPAPTEGGQP